MTKVENLEKSFERITQVSAWEEYRWKCMRAETIRNLGRLITEAERDELDTLNMWLQVHTTRI